MTVLLTLLAFVPVALCVVLIRTGIQAVGREALLAREVSELETRVEELSRRENLSDIVTYYETAGARSAPGGKTEESVLDSISLDDASVESRTDSAYSPSINAALGEGDGHRRAYLTIDDGPSIYTDEILDILKEHDVKATFFVCGTGELDERFRHCYKRIVDEGHVIGMHSWSHKYSEVYYSAESFQYDLDKIRNLIYNETGVAADIYRFPGGSGNRVAPHDMSDYIAVLYAGGLEYYDWNVYVGDSSGGKSTASQIVANTLNGSKGLDTAVILLHDTGAKRSTVDALPEMIEGLRAQGMELLPFDENVPILHQYEYVRDGEGGE
ncbi:MAG: polysaccharide deacetylase [Lachnospiraceae bacterium]|nr:polysaccharide deacetylase [Lachnospiraceae bacterium]